MMGRWVARGILIALAFTLALTLRPLASMGGVWSGAVLNLLAGGVFALAAIVAERALQVADLRAVVGAAIGVLVGGLMAAILVRLLPERAAGFPIAAFRPFVYLTVLYLAAAAGTKLAGMLRGESFVGLLGKDAPVESPGYKILDTSVIIDGRIADVCETGFLDGALVIPSFVLRELQYIADAADPLRRARGRRGLETLQKIKKAPSVKVTFREEEFPEIRDVDLKLIELARHLHAKLLTNDFNLNKVASIRGVEVLNLNELANALKPVVLPGESMKVSILREGKEPNQGVAYLDDGTMVVVEQARGLIGRTVEVVVTSVLQTTAGKMFFGKIVGPEAVSLGSAARNVPVGPPPPEPVAAHPGDKT